MTSNTVQAASSSAAVVAPIAEQTGLTNGRVVVLLTAEIKKLENLVQGRLVDWQQSHQAERALKFPDNVRYFNPRRSIAGQHIWIIPSVVGAVSVVLGGSFRALRSESLGNLPTGWFWAMMAGVLGFEAAAISIYSIAWLSFRYYEQVEPKRREARFSDIEARHEEELHFEKPAETSLFERCRVLPAAEDALPVILQLGIKSIDAPSRAILAQNMSDTQLLTLRERLEDLDFERLVASALADDKRRILDFAARASACPPDELLRSLRQALALSPNLKFSKAIAGRVTEAQRQDERVVKALGTHAVVQPLEEMGDRRVTLDVAGTQMSADSEKLSTYPHFNTLLRESVGLEKAIEIQFADSKTFSLMLGFIETKELSLSKQNVFLLLGCAEKFEVVDLMEQCLKYIWDNRSGFAAIEVLQVLPHVSHSKGLENWCIDELRKEIKRIAARGQFEDLNNYLERDRSSHLMGIVVTELQDSVLAAAQKRNFPRVCAILAYVTPKPHMRTVVTSYENFVKENRLLQNLGHLKVIYSSNLPSLQEDARREITQAIKATGNPVAEIKKYSGIDGLYMAIEPVLLELNFTPNKLRQLWEYAEERKIAELRTRCINFAEKTPDKRAVAGLWTLGSMPTPLHDKL